MAEKVNKIKQRRRKDKQINDNEGDDKAYFQWNIQMERSLADILREERLIGYKGDGGWKAIAYNPAAAILSAQFDIEVSADNIRNRVKTWKRFYDIVSDILSQSGFNWDATKKMISVDEDNVWDEYVKSHEDARTFRFKVIANWDDIVDLCGKDRATGEGAETCAEATDVMTPESDPNNIVDLESDTQGFESCQVDDVSPSSSCLKKRNQKPSDIPPPKKRGTTNVLADSVAKMALSLEQFINSTTQKLDPTEVYNEVIAIPDLSPDEQLKACSWFIENDKQFLMLKAIPIERKKGMVLMFISPRA